MTWADLDREAQLRVIADALLKTPIFLGSGNVNFIDYMGLLNGSNPRLAASRLAEAALSVIEELS